MVYPLADALIACEVPFVFSTGYDLPDLPKRYVDRPLCGKPTNEGDLVRLMSRFYYDVEGPDVE